MSPELFSTSEPQPAIDTREWELSIPLAERMRPQSLDDFFGQKHLVGDGKLLRRSIMADQLHSAIFYGPPGTGKTTLARIIANVTNSYFDQVNAVTSNSAEIKRIIENAKKRKAIRVDKKSVLFIDEIHRFNKAQQDLLMPAVEAGDILLLGATTHNPSFSINGPLLSRSLVFELFPLTEEDIVGVLQSAIAKIDTWYDGVTVQIDVDAMAHFAKQCSGDARKALNALDTAIKTTQADKNKGIHISAEIAEECIQKKIVRYDTNEDYHYDTISAFIKSVRGSDPDAAVYWMAKMLYAGEDPLFIARRIVILASEDIGNADPHALSVAVNALRALEFVGMPEGRIILAQAVTYLASAPKSNAAYMAVDNALKDVREDVACDVPFHLRDGSSRVNREHQKKQPYIYPHDYPGNFIVQNYGGTGKIYYSPTNNGYEKIIKQRLDTFRAQKNQKKGEGKNDSK